MTKVYMDPYELRPNRGTKCTKEEDRTRQSEALGADINLLIKKYEQTGMLPERREGQFLDISAMPTYQVALEQVARAREVFMKLPAEVRAVFENDPARLLDDWNAGENAELFERIGWLEKKPEPKGVVAPGEPVVPPKAG